MTDWIHICSLSEIPARGARTVATSFGGIAVFKTDDGGVFAIRDRCPHKGGPLSQGLVHGHKVTCPLHNWVIDLESGEAVAPDHGCAQRYAVKIDAEQVYLALTETHASA